MLRPCVSCRRLKILFFLFNAHTRKQKNKPVGYCTVLPIYTTRNIYFHTTFSQFFIYNFSTINHTYSAYRFIKSTHLGGYCPTYPSRKFDVSLSSRPKKRKGQDIYARARSLHFRASLALPRVGVKLALEIMSHARGGACKFVAFNGGSSLSLSAF